MNWAIDIPLLGLTFILGTIPLLLTARLKQRLPKLLKTTVDENHLEPAAVILPCKGLDPGFRENIRSWIAQDHPGLELIFVVATADDPAHDVLRRLLEEPSVGDRRVDARVVVAGVCKSRAQKLTNQLVGIQRASTGSKIFVFVDSDCRPDQGFIRRLVAPLTESKVGATTGYRWYHPPRPTLGSLLRSTWNAGALPFLVDRNRVFAWGGAMAIRRETFEDAGIGQRWERAVSDDMTLTVAVRKLGLEIHFVPRCIAVSYESSTIAETLEFTNRQSLISRIYFPPLWWSTAIGHAMANVMILYGLFSLAMWVRGRTEFFLGIAALLLLPLQLANAAWLFGSVKQLVPQLTRELEGLRWRYIFTAPLASLMTLINTVHSVMTRRITWRGVRYELRSPTETVVLDSDN